MALRRVEKRQMPYEAADPVLAFTGVSKRFTDGTVALAGVDLRVTAGEFVSVVGPSGCGKSTLLRIASGLSDASEGSVQVHAEQLGYVFQDPTLLPWRSVQANVELFAELHGLSKDERRRRANDAIKLVGLSDFARHRPRALSGGMRMRVSLARSLTLQPELFLFDEPFGALDEITRERLNDELLQLYLTRRFAALFVTHSVIEAVFLSTRVVVLSGRPGRTLGSFAVPFEYPRSPTLRFAPKFSQIAREVSACLRGAEAADERSAPAPREGD
jgi:NitT/TauT family transport system ATP-binding protein